MDHVAVFLPNRGFFGASLVVIPALLELRRRFPCLQIRGFSVSPAHACFRSWGLIDEFCRYVKPPARGSVTCINRSLRGRAAMMVNMRPGSEWVQLWSWMVPSDRRHAFDQGLGRFLAHHHPRFDVTIYKAFNYLRLLPGAMEQLGDDLLAGWPSAHPVPVDAGHLVILPSGSDPRKLWSLDAYRQVTEAWMQHKGTRVTFIAGPSERALSEWFNASGLGLRRGYELLDGVPMADQVRCIRSAAVVVQNDCGPGHLAQLVNRPRVVLFPDWGDPREWFRPGPRAQYLQAAAGCPIASIPVDAVVRAVFQVAA